MQKSPIVVLAGMANQDAERDKENRETLFAQQIERLREDHQAELAAMRTRAVGGEEPEADEDAICLYSDDEEGSQGGVAESYLESEAAAEQNKRLEVQARNQVHAALGMRVCVRISD